MADILPATTFRPIDGMEMNRVPDGAMIYQANQERVHFLNPTALVVFELCGMDKNAAEIEAFVAEAFGLASAPTEVVRDCLSSLVEEGLVVACAPSSSAP
ncbi:MAG: hypothetical protein JWQ89_2717 [Devosia sp.]|uniref:hypothetical protein n=1 Tax=Devosia sp. TaxID=1871048 RepID=UPI002626D28D|nr:hypothetical protein [Devosia sp.]MDB5540990.1 hypothetical protein [Devosia sp.]